MQLPETTIANQSLLKMAFRNASQVDVFPEVFSMGGVPELNFAVTIICETVYQVRL